MRTMARAIGALVCASSFLFAVHCGAAPASRLVYSRGEGAESCPNESALRQAVKDRVGYDPFFPWAKVTVAAAIRIVHGKLRGHVTIINEDGLEKGGRDIDARSDDCAELVTAMALAVSIALDSLEAPPVAADPAPAAEAPTLPTTPPTNEPPASPPAPKEEAPPPTEDEKTVPIYFQGGLGLHGDVGFAPTIAAGAGAQLGLRASFLGVLIEGTYDAPAGTADHGDGHIEVDHYALTLLPCVHRSILFGCAEGSYGVIHARGISATQGSGSAELGALGGRLGVELPFAKRFSLVGHVEVLGNLNQPRFEIHGGDSWTLSPVSGKAGILALVRFHDDSHRLVPDRGVGAPSILARGRISGALRGRVRLRVVHAAQARCAGTRSRGRDARDLLAHSR